MSELRGRVIRVRSRRFEVELDGDVVPVLVPKALRFHNPDFVDPVAVGDTVLLEKRGDEWIVLEVVDRTNALIRPASGRRGKSQILAASVDVAVVVLAARSPQWKAATLDRYLVLASASGIPSAFCLNKMDLAPEEKDHPDLQPYRDLDIPLVFTSIETGEGLEDLSALLRDRVGVLIGSSGVGKSSLVNALHPSAELRVGEVSDRTDKGTHTTTWVEMIRLAGGGRLIDSPGIRVLDLTATPPEDLADHFPEMVERAGGCRFPDCRHRTEPDCAVKAALGAGVAESRYDSYCRIQDSLGEGRG